MKIVKIISILKIIFGLVFVWLIGSFTLLALGAASKRIPLNIKLLGLILTLFIIIYVINGFLILTLKNWARKMSIALDIGAICLDLFILIPIAIADFRLRYSHTSLNFYAFHLTIIAIFAIFIYYFTRVRVKDLFK